jgi:hypothetical protein
VAEVTPSTDLRHEPWTPEPAASTTDP